MDEFGKVTWIPEDLENALEVQDVKATPENVQKLLEYFDHVKNAERFEEAMIEAGWNFIYSVINEMYDKGEFEE